MIFQGWNSKIGIAAKCYIYLNNDPFAEQRLLFGRHDKVMGFVFVVDDVFQVDASDGVEFFEELLIENESHARNFFDACLGFRFLVNQIGRNGNGQSSTEFLAFEP
jgi:hypothetical protein